MSKPRRIFLLVLSAPLAAIVFGLGIYIAQSEGRSSGSEFFSFLMALLLTAPLWLPAVIPQRFRLLGLVVRWLAAAVMLVPLAVSAYLMLHQIQLYPKAQFSIILTVMAALLCAGCATAVVILVLPGAQHVDKAA